MRKTSTDYGESTYDTIEIAEPSALALYENAVLSQHRKSRSMDVFQAASNFRTSYSSIATGETYLNGSKTSFFPKAIENIYTPQTYHIPVDQEDSDAGYNEKEKSMYSMAHASEFNGDSGTTTPAVTPPAAAPPPGPPQRGPAFSTLHEVAFITNLCLAQFLSLAALAQTVAPLLIIGDSLHVQDLGALSWFTAAFSLTVGTLLLPSGKKKLLD